MTVTVQAHSVVGLSRSRIFRISFTTPLKGHDLIEELEWIAPSDWEADQVQRCFRQRFPHAAVRDFLEVNPWHSFIS